MLICQSLSTPPPQPHLTPPSPRLPGLLLQGCNVFRVLLTSSSLCTPRFLDPLPLSSLCFC